MTHGDMTLSVFSQTLLFFSANDLTVDLRRPVSPATLEQLENIGLGQDFCVITAHNPFGRTITAEENKELHEQLAARLAKLECLHTPCVGMNPERIHREDGFAVRLALPDAVELARAFEQLALFQFDGESFWSVPVLMQGTPARLPWDHRGQSQSG